MRGKSSSPAGGTSCSSSRGTRTRVRSSMRCRIPRLPGTRRSWRSRGRRRARSRSRTAAAITLAVRTRSRSARPTTRLWFRSAVADSPATSTRSGMNDNAPLNGDGPALELKDVEVVYERRGRERLRAVAGASLTVERGQIVGLVGESGCGKSSLARASVGLVPTTAGTVRFEGREVTPLTRRARPRELARLQMVFQNPYSSLNPRRKIGSQLADALDVLGLAPSADRRGRVEELLDLVGLPASAAARYPHQFSGGQRQRIAVARALAADPSVLVLDEPLASLDASAQAQVANLLVDLSRRLSLSLLLISHDLAIVRHVADVVSVMYLGVMVETGSTQPLWSVPLHPYTEALIAAVPRPDGSGFLPEALPGEVPDPANPPNGCRFHPRCPYVFDRCRVDEPQLEPHEANRSAACWLRNGTDLSPLATSNTVVAPKPDQREQDS